MHDGPMTSFTLSGHASSAGEYFYAWIKDSKVYARNPAGEPMVVGVLLSKYNEVEATAKSFQERLIELGEIQVPLTQEQMTEQLLTELKEEKMLRNKMALLVEEMSTKIKHLEHKDGVGYESEKPIIGSDVRSPSLHTAGDSDSNIGAEENGVDNSGDL